MSEYCDSYDPTSWSPLEMIKGAQCASSETITSLANTASEAGKVVVKGAQDTAKDLAKNAPKLAPWNQSPDLKSILIFGGLGLVGAVAADAYLTGGAGAKFLRSQFKGRK